jgi:hypothetical protein
MPMETVQPRTRESSVVQEMFSKQLKQRIRLSHFVDDALLGETSMRL